GSSSRLMIFIFDRVALPIVPNRGGDPPIWWAQAPRLLNSCALAEFGENRDGGGAIVSRRGACAPQIGANCSVACAKHRIQINRLLVSHACGSSTSMNSTEACIALNMLPTMGPVRLRKLLEVFGSPEQILSAKRDQLRKVDGVGNEVADQIANWESVVDLQAELRRIAEFGATVITQNSPEYPKSLREIHSPP